MQSFCFLGAVMGKFDSLIIITIHVCTYNFMLSLLIIYSTFPLYGIFDFIFILCDVVDYIVLFCFDNSLCCSVIRCWNTASFHEAYRITVGLGGLGSGFELCVWTLLFLRSQIGIIMMIIICEPFLESDSHISY